MLKAKTIQRKQQRAFKRERGNEFIEFVYSVGEPVIGSIGGFVSDMRQRPVPAKKQRATLKQVGWVTWALHNDSDALKELLGVA